MKRILSIILAVFLVLATTVCLVGCTEVNQLSYDCVGRFCLGGIK